MNSPEFPIEPIETSTPENETPSSGLPPEPDESMQEFYQLQEDLLKITLILTGIIFGAVWIFYSLNIALNYLIGACTGVVYLRMLARNVAQLGRERSKLSSSRLALLVGVILVASRLDQLQIMPIFLGFMTYKAAVIFYMLRTSILPGSDA
ncbi:MAG: ATP synthase subunit I [Elainella sp. Prado103]|nr:ATP synthase subunit I [Elainella sp. Prado103]